MQLTTAFTIIFVLIFTTFLKRFALWRVQTGETVARLEQYQASTSLPSTFKAILSLRSFNVVSCALVFAWSFYYLGSQASSREYRYETSKPYKNGKFGIAYQSDVTKSVFDPTIYSATPAYNITILSRTFNQRCLPYLDQGSDYRGNMIIPWFDNGTGWQDFRVQQDTYYTSCAGIKFEAEPFRDPKGDESSDSSTLIGNFHFNSSYIEMDCSAPTLANINNFPKGVLENNPNTINISSVDEVNENIYMDVWQRYNKTAVKSTCTIWTQPVELKGHCSGSSCQVSWGRFRDYDWDAEVFKNTGFARNFLEELVVNQLSWLQLYTNWIDLPGYVKKGGSLFSHVSARDPFDEPDWGWAFTYRLQQTFNTWYYASQSVRNPESWRDPWITNQEMYNIIIGKQNSDIFARSTFKGAIYRPAYRLNVGWVIADIMSNTVLLAAAIVSFWLRKHTLAPDIFGYVSSLTRDNPNVPLPEGGTALSGWDRARLLRDVRVRIAASTDTGSDGVGRVVLARADAAPVEMKPLEKHMHYV